MRKPRRPSRRVTLIGAGVVVAALIAGLVVWAPWNPSPVAPASLGGTSPTATSIKLTWPKPNGGATPDHYVILRDGKQDTTVPASMTTWTDTTVQPGETHTYAVATAGGGTQSGPSPVTTVTAITPAPVEVHATATYTTASLSWKPSPLGPAPDHYLIYSNGNVLDTISGTTTTYTDTSLTTGTPFQFTVIAQWGTHKSDASAPAAGSTLAAALNSNISVNVTLTSVPSGSSNNATVGKAYSYEWTFTPACTANSCTIALDGGVPVGTGENQFTVNLTGGNSGYSGSFKAKWTLCGSTQVNDTINLQLSPDNGAISNGQWTSWHGTVIDNAPYTTDGSSSYCPAQSWNYSVTGKS